MIKLTGVAIRLRNCAKTFPDGTRALEPLDFEIAAGETVVLLGPSGCGKTTTLRIIAGLERADAGGRVFFDDDDVTDIPIERRNVGMVFQSYALFPHLTVAENIGYGLTIRKVPAEERGQRIAEMLDMMRISALGNRRIDELSGGQKQRVALARAIIVRPRVLLLDEPLTALDAKLREDLRLEIDALLRSLRITAVYVTHDQAEAMALGDRIVVMSHGRVAQVGKPREIYQRPANAFVADFIGTINRIDGEVRDGRFFCAAGSVPFAGDEGSATVMFRPEDAEVAASSVPDALAGTVRNVFFLGDRVRISIDGIGAEPLIVEAPARAEFARGERIAIRIVPGQLALLPKDMPR
jgi:putative spermidine/putrescine transport system ATP-binding protein